MVAQRPRTDRMSCSSDLWGVVSSHEKEKVHREITTTVEFARYRTGNAASVCLASTSQRPGRKHFHTEPHVHTATMASGYGLAGGTYKRSLPVLWRQFQDEESLDRAAMAQQNSDAERPRHHRRGSRQAGGWNGYIWARKPAQTCLRSAHPRR